MKLASLQPSVSIFMMESSFHSIFGADPQISKIDSLVYEPPLGYVQGLLLASDDDDDRVQVSLSFLK